MGDDVLEYTQRIRATRAACSSTSRESYHVRMLSHTALPILDEHPHIRYTVHSHTCTLKTMAAALATALQSQASALRPTTTTVMRPDGSRFRLAKDSLGQEVLLPSDGAAEQGQARMPATNSYLGLTKDTGAPLSEDTNSAAAAAADPHTDVSNTSTTAADATAAAAATAAAEDTAASMSTNMDVSACPRFEASDPHMMAHLDEFGYVVVRNAVGSVDNRREAEELLWAFLEVPNR